MTTHALLQRLPLEALDATDEDGGAAASSSGMRLPSSFSRSSGHAQHIRPPAPCRMPTPCSCANDEAVHAVANIECATSFAQEHLFSQRAE
jgi:hypothetical protein